MHCKQPYKTSILCKHIKKVFYLQFGLKMAAIMPTWPPLALEWLLSTAYWLSVFINEKVESSSRKTVISIMPLYGNRLFDQG